MIADLGTEDGKCARACGILEGGMLFLSCLYGHTGQHWTVHSRNLAAVI